jgi:predicted dehydrogenase
LPKTCLIVGFGSAGQRHAQNASTLGFDVIIVTSGKPSLYPYYPNLRSAFEKENPQAVILASPTSRHTDELKECVAHSVPCLVEKPLTIGFSEFQSQIGDPPPQGNYRVAYCLRYHPMVQKLKSEISSLGPLYDASLVFGQYLPWWRPNTDYRQCYSAFIDQGGGVLLDSSHEIDLIHYLFGDVLSLTAVSRKTSALEIESDDLGVVIFKMTSGQLVQLNLNYLNQIPERRIVINGERGSIHVDLINARYRSYVNDVNDDEVFEIDRNQLFLDELSDFINHPDECLLPDLNESMATLKVIDSIRQSSIEEQWITL